MISVHLEKKDEKTQIHEAVGIEINGVESNEEERFYTYCGMLRQFIKQGKVWLAVVFCPPFPP